MNVIIFLRIAFVTYIKFSGFSLIFIDPKMENNYCFFKSVLN